MWKEESNTFGTLHLSSAFNKTFKIICQRRSNPSPSEEQHMSSCRLLALTPHPEKALNGKKNWETSGRRYQAIPTTSLGVTDVL